MLGEGGVDVAWMIAEVDREGCTSGGDRAVGVQEEPGTCLLKF